MFPGLASTLWQIEQRRSANSRPRLGSAKPGCAVEGLDATAAIQNVVRQYFRVLAKSILSTLHLEARKLRTLAQCLDQPIRLSAPASPRLRGVLGIAVLGAWSCLASAAFAAEQFGDLEPGLACQLGDFALHLGALLVLALGERRLNGIPSLNQLFERCLLNPSYSSHRSDFPLR